MNGERMIKTTKTCLFKTLGRAKSDYFQLLTMISDIQRVINFRPLTYRRTSDTEVLQLTLNALLHPNVNGDISVKTYILAWNLLPGLNYNMLFPKGKKWLNDFKE